MSTKLTMKFIILLFIFGQVLLSCQPISPEVLSEDEASFKKLFPFDMNTTFVLRADSSNQGTFQNRSNIHLIVENKSERELFFPVGFGIKLLILRNNNWTEVQNENSYFGEGSFLPSINSSSYINRLSLYVRPRLLEGLTENVKIEVMRVVLIGEIISDGKLTGTLVGSYIDVLVEK